MAKVKVAAANMPDRIRQVLRSGLAISGIKAQIRTEPIRGTKLHRVLVNAPAFKELKFSERQDLVWRIIGQSFSTEEQLKISMILTLAPKE